MDEKIEARYRNIGSTAKKIINIKMLHTNIIKI